MTAKDATRIYEKKEITLSLTLMGDHDEGDKQYKSYKNSKTAICPSFNEGTNMADTSQLLEMLYYSGLPMAMPICTKDG